LGPKEQAFIADITKEYVKDIVGQFCILYPVSSLYTKIHPIYDEAIEKVFENPIKLDILAGQPEQSQTYNRFGIDGDTSLEMFVQSRDLLDKGIEIFAGDFFVYGSQVYEILTAVTMNNIYGQAEYEKAVKITSKLCRSGQFDINTFKEMLDLSKIFAEDQSNKNYIQQRGLEETADGPTNDYRQIRDRLDDQLAPIALDSGAKKVATEPTENIAINPKTSGFYHE
jgi:hypothetical protein